ncbi:MAG TPA: ABC transporter ATP-binding protein [Deferribacteraceae bacterium]|nr:ABC transporter ATP-binding protein [Deferribacteraceae bacterium]
MLEVESVSKSFKLYNKPADRLKEIITRKSRHRVHHALKNISFSVNDGETLGIIGKNGAGKSTLLKIVVGVTLPDTGTVRKDGNVTGLLELGTGFNFEMSGYDNIYLNGSLLGIESSRMKQIEQDIIEFTELGDFISKPIKTYSSGMVMRLAFSIAVHSNPKCFVVDEALSVGDAYFQHKCMRKIMDFKKQGGSIIFVSHDMNAVKMLCDRAVLIHNGEITEEGDPETVVNKYNYLIAVSEDSGIQKSFKIRDDSSYGNLDVEIQNVKLEGRFSKSCNISSGEPVDIVIELFSKLNVDNISIGIMIRDRFGQDIFGTNTYLCGQSFRLLSDSLYEVGFSFDMNIGSGKYYITAAVHTGESHIEKCYHWVDRACEFEVAGVIGKPFAGVVRLTPEISFCGKERS